jgi:hypothetical protein
VSLFSLVRVQIIDKLLVFLYTPDPKAQGSTGSAAADETKQEEVRSFKPHAKNGRSFGSAVEMSPLKPTPARGARKHFEGYFKETDLQGQTYECKGLWSTDVAKEWGARVQAGGVPLAPNAAAQHILRACNLQAVLVEAVSLEQDIAWKGSICTPREKDESERRLTLVKRAMLRLALSFAEKNPQNQAAVFGALPDLTRLATPPELATDETRDGQGFNDKAPDYVPSPGLASLQVRDPSMAWPHTLHEYGQALLTEVLRGNELLAEQVPSAVRQLFAAVAELADDVSSSPALASLQTLCLPERRPVKGDQIAVAEILTSERKFPRIFAAARQAVMGVEADDGWSGGGGKGSTALAAKGAAKSTAAGHALLDPARVVKLLSTCLEGGNEDAAAALAQNAGLTLDVSCVALVKLVNEESGSSGGGGVGPQHALAVLTAPLGGALLGLVAEQVFLLPMTSEQVTSEPLWAFLGNVAGPAMEALAAAAEPFDCAALQ